VTPVVQAPYGPFARGKAPGALRPKVGSKANRPIGCNREPGAVENLRGTPRPRPRSEERRRGHPAPAWPTPEHRQPQPAAHGGLGIVLGVFLFLSGQGQARVFSASSFFCWSSRRPLANGIALLAAPPPGGARPGGKAPLAQPALVLVHRPGQNTNPEAELLNCLVGEPLLAGPRPLRHGGRIPAPGVLKSLDRRFRRPSVVRPRKATGMRAWGAAPSWGRSDQRNHETGSGFPSSADLLGASSSGRG